MLVSDCLEASLEVCSFGEHLLKNLNLYFKSLFLRSFLRHHIVSETEAPIFIEVVNVSKRIVEMLQQLFFDRCFLFNRANIRWCRFRKTNKTLGSNPVKEVLIVTLITASVSYFNPYTRRSSSSLIRQVCIASYLLDLWS